MSRKNETTILVLSLLITVGLIGSGLWVANHSWLDIGKILNNITHDNSNSATPPNQSLKGLTRGSNFQSVQNIQTGRFRYGGSTTWAPIRRDVDAAINKELPQFQIVYTDPIGQPPGSGTGIQMLLQNQLAFSQSSRSLKDNEYLQAQVRGLKLKEIPVAVDGIAIAVNPNLNIPGLTLSQIKDIYTGKFRNWKDLGGPDLEISPYSRRNEGGTVEFFVNHILQNEKFGSNTQTVDTTTEALRKVSRNKAGIYYASAPEVVGQCGVKPLPVGKTFEQLIPPYQEPYIPSSECPQKRNILNEVAFSEAKYPITRRLFVIVKQNGQIDEQAGETYARLLLTAQGQELIAKAGFVRIR